MYSSTMKMIQMKKWKVLLQMVILTELMVLGTLCNGEDTSGHLRKSRSIKDDFIKDGSVMQSRTIVDMRNKIHSLEGSVKNMSAKVSSVDTKLVKIAEQSNQFQRSFSQQLQMMQQLNGEVAALKQVLTGHGRILGDLEKIASSDDNLFAMSNQTCGGVLIGQSGFIHFSSAALSSLGSTVRRPSTCVWTIRANNRRNVKIQTFSPHSTYSYSATSNPNAYLVEIRKKNGSSNDAANLKIKLTKLEKNMRYNCNGPVVFVVYLLTSGATTTTTIQPLELHYEGSGKFSEENTLFSHESLFENSGRFGSDQLTPDDWAESNNVTYSMDYTSIFISNFSTKVYLQVNLENDTCQDKNTSFVVITNLLDTSNVAFVDCCRQSCKGNNSLISYDSPFLILFTKMFQAPAQFNFSWQSETPFPSSSGLLEYSYSDYKCGAVLGGTSGSIYYKPRVTYGNGERCIWAIIPQPRPRSSILIDMGVSGVANTYDRLYLMELTDINGTALANPRITHLRSYGTHRAYSREAYIVFYSDSSITGQGFSLSWRSAGDLVRTGKDVSMKFSLLKGQTGSKTSLQERTGLPENMYQVFLLAPISMGTKMYGLKLFINQTQPPPSAITSGSCVDDDILVYATYNGLFRKVDRAKFCGDSNNQSVPGQVGMEFTDEMAIIALNDTRSLDSPPVSIDFSWQEEFGTTDDDNLLTIDNDECGGVIIGDKGVLKYKIGEEYFNNERCVWLLQTPNHTSITLDLVREDFENCCDYILVNTIVTGNGTLRNGSTTVINRDNSTVTFRESVLIITFRSDASTRGRGFALQFTGKGVASSSPEYSYQLHHINELVGAVEYPGSEWEDPVPGTNEIVVIAASYKISSEQDSLAMSTNVSWSSGIFKRESEDYEGNCTYESISFYTSPSRYGWQTRNRLPVEEDKQSCPTEIIAGSKNPHLFFTAYSVFLAIYRRLPIPAAATATILDSDEEISENNQTVSGIKFSFHKSAGCGGVIIGDSGEISYKEDGPYSNHERCIWLVEAPQAKKIELKLEKSEFEIDCDALYIYTFDRDGDLVSGSVLQHRSSTAIVDGPVAIIVFTSDHSVTGFGFRLTYSNVLNATEPFPYTFQLDHKHDPFKNKFSFQVEENEIAVAAFSREPSSTSRHGLVNVTALRSQLDETCQSDTLTFYNVYGVNANRIVSFKSFDALSVLKGDALSQVRNETLSEHCSPLGNSQFNECSNSISNCTDLPNSHLWYVNGTSFIAIYKSVNVSTQDLEYRGFALTSQ